MKSMTHKAVMASPIRTGSMQELQRAVNVLYQMSIMAEFNSSLMEKQADYKHKTGQAGSDSSMADSSVSAAATSQTAHWGQMSLDADSDLMFDMPLPQHMQIRELMESPAYTNRITAMSRLFGRHLPGMYSPSGEEDRRSNRSSRPFSSTTESRGAARLTRPSESANRGRRRSPPPVPSSPPPEAQAAERPESPSNQPITTHLLEMGFSAPHIKKAVQALGVTGEVTAHAKNNLATWMLEHPLEAGEEEGAATAASAAASSSSRVDSSSDTESPFPEADGD
ncbi:hypothetical protein EB796_000604 [Bugula neritina]|uniref:UBA domain-containing protein n=1 Tax=Bugula neritina TaxID=10212 RepID=A0A7J7KSE1_BUGNE|nr:hypothetical protein EB796_000604 [Bugula neritina]